jgi:hypothetical protein
MEIWFVLLHLAAGLPGALPCCAGQPEIQPNPISLHWWLKSHSHLGLVGFAERVSLTKAVIASTRPWASGKSGWE